MTRDAIIEKLRAIIYEHLEALPHEVEIAADTRFDELDLDSLSIVEIAMDVEDAFAVEVTDEEIADTQTLGVYVALVEGKLKEAVGG